MTTTGTLRCYDWRRSYEWNYEHAPEESGMPALRPEPVPGGPWEFCGLPVASPLGMPAGPLLNGRWVLHYAGLGFDVLTYKTVRSAFRASYPLPNLQPVRAPDLRGGEQGLPAGEEMEGSWAISFGMPSMHPDVWRADLEWTRRRLPEGKILSVSVVGTMQPGWTLEELAADYARCARWAVASGADCIEANLSCPNVQSRDGQLYQQPDAARIVTAAVREAVGQAPLILKIAPVTQRGEAAALAAAVAPCADALAMVNCLAATVVGPGGNLLFDGQVRGIGGQAIREASIAQTRLFSTVIREEELALKLIGVGGAATAVDVRRYLEADAHAVHIATAAMLDPEVGLKIRREW
jgi:dihydroorotate dehydrogenase (NAD+) catalytic subunit